MVVGVVSKQLLLEQANKGQHWQLSRVFRIILINTFDEKSYIEIISSVGLKQFLPLSYWFALISEISLNLD